MSVIRQLDEAYRRFRQYWVDDIWAYGAVQTPSFKDRIRLLASRTIYIVVDGFRRDRIKLRAAALTYVSLLSLVPALVVGFSLFSAFGGIEATEAKLKSFIINALAVDSQRTTILGYLDQLLETGGSAKLGTVGTAILLLTVVSLLSNIELSFNDIWGLTKSRSMLQRFQVYWPLITLAPILLGVSISLGSAFEGHGAIQRLIATIPGVGWITHLVSMMATCLFFTLLYQIMPNTRVPLRHAAVGGFVAGVLWMTAQQLYAIYAANAITYSALYGSLGAIPLFIIWIYVSWIVTLLGAMLTFAVQSARTYEPKRRIAWRDREFVAVRLMVAVASRFVRGDGALTAQEAIDKVLVPPRTARQLLEILVRHGLLTETIASEDDLGYVPGRPIDTIKIVDVLHVLRADKGIEPLLVHEDDQTGRDVRQRLDQAEAEGDRTLEATMLSELLPPPPTPHDDTSDSGGTVRAIK